MKRQNPSRDLPKTVGGTTPVNYRSSSAVYRSLSAVPAQLEVAERTTQRVDKPFSSLVGPQTKTHGEVVWAETKTKVVTEKEAHPLPIPLIVANAPYNSLLLESNPVSKVVGAVHLLLEQHNVDTQFNDVKFKWKCACYDAHTETRFVCRLFSVPDRANYFILDFQRRNGDAMYFHSIYKAINYKLLKSGFVIPCGESRNMVEPEIRSFKPRALPADFFSSSEQDEEEEKDAKEYEPLCKMCISPFIDVQREGLSALANHMEQSEFARKSLAPFAEKLIEAVSLSRDIQVRRLATSAIANCSSEKTAHIYIQEKGGLRVLTEILLDEQELLETRRQAGKVLLNVGIFNADVASLIKRAQVASIKDARLSQIFRDIRTRVA